MRVWYNQTYSSIYNAMTLIRQHDGAGRYHLIYTASSRTVAAHAAHQFELEPPLKGNDYLEWCLDFCRRQDIGIFVPHREAALISGARERFAAIGARVLAVASPEVLALLHDKARFYATVDLPMAAPPETVPFHTAEQFDAGHAALRAKYPQLCVKPAKSVYGLGFALLDEARSTAQILMSGDQYQVGLQDFRAGLAGLGEFRTMLLMEFLEGLEYSVDCVADDGRLVCAVPRRKLVKPGMGQLIDPQPVILQATAQLAAAYRLNGVFNVQFRESGDRVRLLEINPRMSGGIGMACMAGPALPWLALAGFDRGYGRLEIPAVRAGVRVGEWQHAIELGES
ncbi:ATP-grasp domain-containing protein [Massilia sp. METH4]|uniref:ATP-grasp domain-containing protein n=1 Tax=Massilia sp. METH4 TaxID=3123041 RepID=UPI0030D2DDF6